LERNRQLMTLKSAIEMTKRVIIPMRMAKREGNPLDLLPKIMAIWRKKDLLTRITTSNTHHDISAATTSTMRCRPEIIEVRTCVSVFAAASLCSIELADP
jgi:hypothetical protein